MKETLETSKGKFIITDDLEKINRMKKINDTLKEPKLEDFYDKQDPRGCSSSEYNEYLKALGDYNILKKL